MDTIANTSAIEETIYDFDDDFDLCVLPEMFTTGFGNQSTGKAETLNLHTHKWMKMIAGQKNCLVIGSLPIKENNKFFNRCLIVFPSQETLFYDKVHLFSMAKEDEQFTSGEKKLLFDFKNWKIMVNICYDLRFPLFCRNSVDNTYDLMINIANWPEPRFKAYDSLLCARAIENLSFVIGVNRTGEDVLGLNYLPMNHAYDFKGEHIVPVFQEKTLCLYDFNLKTLKDFREKFNTLKDEKKYV